MLAKIVEPLIEWYEENHRILPWRASKNPYYIWISEIMLQQTRVKAVRPFFEQFIKALPKVEDVAVCPEEQLLKLWEGLGYYNRVRNIQKAAVRIVKEYGGRLPADYEKLKELLDNENKILDVRSKVKEYVNNKYNWDKVSEDTEKAYKALKSK